MNEIVILVVYSLFLFIMGNLVAMCVCDVFKRKVCIKIDKKYKYQGCEKKETENGLIVTIYYELKEG